MLMQDNIRAERATDLGLDPSAGWAEISATSQRRAAANDPIMLAKIHAAAEKQHRAERRQADQPKSWLRRFLDIFG